MNLLNESILYYLVPLRKTLKLLSKNSEESISKIANDLLSIEKTNIKQDITLVGLSDNDGFVDFTSSKNIFRNLKDSTYINSLKSAFEEDPNLPFIDAALDDAGELTTYLMKSRTPSRIGRLINTFFPNKYSQKEIETFTNEFKSVKERNSEKIFIVEGDDISFWYNSDNYYSIDGTLGNSCMRSKRGIFDIYTKNTQVCRMIIITEEGKLKARALLWKVNKSNEIDFEYFMDRQYVIKDEYVNKLRSFAEKNGFAYKYRNNHQSLKDIWYNGGYKSIDIKIQLNKFKGDSFDYNQYPYMDTFRCYNVKNGILYNDSDGEIGDYKLEDTDGGYSEIEDTVYSDYYDEDIPRERSIYSSVLGDWFRRDDVVEVTGGNSRRHGIYPDDWDDIVNINGVYYHTDDCIFSDIMGEYIAEDTAISVINGVSANSISEDYLPEGSSMLIDISKLGKATQEFLHRNSNCGYILESILSKIGKRYIINALKVELFDVIYLSNKIQLSKLDCFILDIPLDKESNPIISDMIEYNNTIYRNIKLYNTIIKSIDSKLRIIQRELPFNEPTNLEIRRRLQRIGTRGDDLEEKYFNIQD